MDEQVAGDRQVEARAPRPFGQVIVVEESQSEPGVEPANGFVYAPGHQQAEAGELGRSHPFAPVLIAPPPREAFHVGEVAVRHVLNQLRGRRIVRHRTNQSDFRLWVLKLGLA